MIYELKPQFDTRKSFYNKAVVIAEGDTLTLKSYNTNILQLDTNTNTLTFLTKNIKHFTMTTNRHINEFLLQFTTHTKKTKSELLKLANII
jgi:hypothetical protein